MTETMDLDLPVGSLAVANRDVGDLEVELRGPEKQIKVAEWIEIAEEAAALLDLLICLPR